MLTMATSFLSIFLIFMQWQITQSGGNHEAKVIDAYQQEENNYMALVQDPRSPSGWSIKIKNDILYSDLDGEYMLNVYTRTDPYGEWKEIWSEYLCESFTDPYNQKGTFVGDILNMIFPDHDGSCIFHKSQTMITQTAQVNTDSTSDYQLPKTLPFQAEVRIMTFYQTEKKGQPNYRFKITFNVGRDTYKYKK